MKTPIWNKADAKRASKMGWRLQQVAPHYPARIALWGERFKSDDEAIEWVIEVVESLPLELFENDQLYKTCRKALFLCAKG